MAKPQQKWAVLVGINDYGSPSGDLEGCVNDVKKISTFLRKTVKVPERTLSISFTFTLTNYLF
jgi:hypothetical protein